MATITRIRLDALAPDVRSMISRCREGTRVNMSGYGLPYRNVLITLLTPKWVEFSDEEWKPIGTTTSGVSFTPSDTPRAPYYTDDDPLTNWQRGYAAALENTLNPIHQPQAASIRAMWGWARFEAKPEPTKRAPVTPFGHARPSSARPQCQCSACRAAEPLVRIW